MIRGRIESKIDSLIEQVDSLATEDFEIADDCASRGTIKAENIDWVRVENLMEEYELWYNEALTLISTYLPKREPDFIQTYSNLSSVIRFDDCNYAKLAEYNSHLRRNLIQAIPPKLDAEELRVRKGLRMT